MLMRIPTTIAALASLAALAACGGSSGPSSSGSSGNGGSGSSFCQQAQQASTDITDLGTAFASSIAGGTSTPDPSAFKQLMQQASQDLDNLDSQAPSDIASAFHHLRTVFDQVNSQIQSASSFDDMQSPVAALNDSSVQSDQTAVNNYMTNVCHITPAPSPSPT